MNKEEEKKDYKERSDEDHVLQLASIFYFDLFAF